MNGVRHASPRILIAILVMTGASCSLLFPNPAVETPTPVAIPTTAQAAAADDEVLGMMRFDESCLWLEQRDGQRVLPIWPRGFSAMTASRFTILEGPVTNAPNVVGAELINVEGEFVDVPPADATIPVECLGSPLFHVATVANRS